MKRFLFGFTWGFMVGVAVMDIYFSWACHSTMLEWESNPAARLALSSQGPFGVILYRILWLAYAGIMANTRTRLSWLVTPVWGAGHVYLLVTLAQSLPYLTTLHC